MVLDKNAKNMRLWLNLRVWVIGECDEKISNAMRRSLVAKLDSAIIEPSRPGMGVLRDSLVHRVQKDEE